MAMFKCIIVNKSRGPNQYPRILYGAREEIASKDFCIFDINGGNVTGRDSEVQDILAFGKARND